VVGESRREGRPSAGRTGAGGCRSLTTVASTTLTSHAWVRPCTGVVLVGYERAGAVEIGSF
jgi:hypothetical protein